jgi:hypothetical protein
MQRNRCCSSQAGFRTARGCPTLYRLMETLKVWLTRKLEERSLSTKDEGLILLQRDQIQKLVSGEGVSTPFTNAALALLSGHRIGSHQSYSVIPAGTTSLTLLVFRERAVGFQGPVHAGAPCNNSQSNRGRELIYSGQAAYSARLALQRYI